MSCWYCMLYSCSLSSEILFLASSASTTAICLSFKALTNVTTLFFASNPVLLHRGAKDVKHESNNIIKNVERKNVDLKCLNYFGQNLAESLQAGRLSKFYFEHLIFEDLQRNSLHEVLNVFLIHFRVLTAFLAVLVLFLLSCHLRKLWIIKSNFWSLLRWLMAICI